MATSTSYRLDGQLKRRLSERAAAEGSTETALVTRLLDEGLKTTQHPGIVYRAGPSGRRAGVAGGPDVWEIVVAVRHADGQGDTKVVAAADQMGLSERSVRAAVNFASEYPAEVEDRITKNEQAAERGRRLAQERERLLAS